MDTNSNVLRDEKGRLLPGQVLNPSGKNKDYFIEQLYEAIWQVEDERGEKFAHKYVKTAYDKMVIMADLARKLWPDLIKGNQKVEHGTTDEFAGILKDITSGVSGKNIEGTAGESNTGKEGTLQR
jgi:hypothetical protein